MNDIPHIIEAALLLLVAFLLGCIIGWILRAKIFKKRPKPTPSNAVESVVKSETQILETVSNTDAKPVQVTPKTKAAPEVKEAPQPAATTPKLNVVSSKPRKASIAKVAPVKTPNPKSAVAKSASDANSSLIDSAEENTGNPDTGALDSGKPDTGKPDTDKPATSKPEALKAARAGGKDDLKKIKGVGPKLEGILNGLGIFHFDQIANWKRAEIDWVDDYLSFKGRIDRDDWINQAKKFSA